MTAAIFGLLGVLIGGVLNGVVSWLVELSRQRDAARASARLLSHELRANQRVLDDAITLIGKSKQQPEAAADKLGELSQAQWTEHKSRLAQGLRAEDFDVISGAYLNLYKIDAAARRLRGLAAAETVKNTRKEQGERTSDEEPELRTSDAAMAAALDSGSEWSCAAVVSRAGGRDSHRWRHPEIREVMARCVEPGSRQELPRKRSQRHSSGVGPRERCGRRLVAAPNQSATTDQRAQRRRLSTTVPCDPAHFPARRRLIERRSGTDWCLCRSGGFRVGRAGPTGHAAALTWVVTRQRGG
jgi:hypothetical protein